MEREDTLKRIRSSGFTLIEIAVAIFLIGLLAGSILVPLSRQHEQRQIKEAETMLAEAREALLGFAATNGYLPCPDRRVGPGANDDAEDVAAGVCVVTTGNLPAATLGLDKQVDPWGNRLSYRVDPDFARRAPAATPTPFSALADVRVCSVSTCATKATILTNFDPAIPVPGDEAVFVVLSHGPNGFGAINASGIANAAPTSADELSNAGAGVAVSRTPSGAGTPAGEFDDVLIWVGRPALMRFMFAAGSRCVGGIPAWYCS